VGFLAFRVKLEQEACLQVLPFSMLKMKMSGKHAKHIRHFSWDDQFVSSTSKTCNAQSSNGTCFPAIDKSQHL